MSFLDNFKTKTGATESDQYLIDNYIQPALDYVASITNNRHNIEVDLINNQTTYDLSGDVVNGVQEIAIDNEYNVPFNYTEDYYFSDPVTLTFVKPPLTVGEISFNYFAYYSIPTLDPYVETDLPAKLWPAVLRYANAIYAKDKINDYSNNNSGNVSSKSEFNLSVSYGSLTERLKVLDMQVKDAEKEIKKIGGWSSRALIYSFQIV